MRRMIICTYSFFGGISHVTGGRQHHDIVGPKCQNQTLKYAQVGHIYPANRSLS